MARLAIALGRGVAEDLDAVGVDDDDALTELVERGEEPVAPLLGIARPRGAAVASACSNAALVAPVRTHDAQPNRPVM